MDLGGSSLFGDLLLYGGKRCGVARDEKHAGTQGGEAQSDRPADTARRAGYESNAAGERGSTTGVIEEHFGHTSSDGAHAGRVTSSQRKNATEFDLQGRVNAGERNSIS
jgi:hypothetical protein